MTTLINVRSESVRSPVGPTVAPPGRTDGRTDGKDRWLRPLSHSLSDSGDFAKSQSATVSAP